MKNRDIFFLAELPQDGKDKMGSIVSIKNLYFRYSEEDRPIFEDFSLEIEEGDFVAIVGHNGSGKSTLAQILAGILVPEKGEVCVKGYSLTDEKQLEEARPHIGMVFQNPDNQIISSIVEEDVAFALENLGVPQPEMVKRVEETLKAVGMEEYAKHSTAKLSGGQKQRIAIAGIVAMRPSLIVMDEPTAMLDPQGRKEVMKTVSDLNKSGITVIMITHYMEEATLADRVIVMNGGHILLDGEPHDVFMNAGLLKSIGLDVPQSTELMFKLREAGFRTPLAILTEEECENVLVDILEGRIEKVE